LVEGVPGAVNVGYGRGKLSLAELAALGVARVSFGPTLQQHLYDKFGSGLLAAVASDETPFVL
jgi:2-methylisocitrate lyase-like PEP mutase family enzyme